MNESEMKDDEAYNYNKLPVYLLRRLYKHPSMRQYKIIKDGRFVENLGDTLTPMKTLADDIKEELERLVILMDAALIPDRHLVWTELNEARYAMTRALAREKARLRRISYERIPS